MRSPVASLSRYLVASLPRWAAGASAELEGDLAVQLRNLERAAGVRRTV
ncbi:hypothetical protein [Streptomyces sp. NPDC058701]